MQYFMPIYRKIKAALIEKYEISPSDLDKVNLCSCRALEITKLFCYVITEGNRSFVSPVFFDVLDILVFNASKGSVTNAREVSPTFVLNLLHLDIYEIDEELDDDFSETYQSMREWFSEFVESTSASQMLLSVLPELRWSDLPSELIGRNS